MKKQNSSTDCELGLHEVSISYDTGNYIIKECKNCDKMTVNSDEWKTEKEWIKLCFGDKDDKKVV
jgi:hypothetical protein